MTPNHLVKKFLAFAGAATLVAGSAQAGDWDKAVIDDKMPIPEPWTFCDIFDMNTLYQGEGLIQKVSLNGRYHGQMISQTEDFGGVDNGYHEWQHRRFRLGMNIAFAGNLTLKTSANISNGSGGAGSHGLTYGPYFDNWDEFYLDWEPNDDFYVQIGKQKQKITREFSTSSKEILTIERSHIVNEVADQKPWGVTVGFNYLGLDHELGAWVTGAYASGFGNYPNFDSRGSLSYRTSYGLTESTDLHLDYVFTNNSDGFASGTGSAATGFASAYEHVVALGSESEWGQFGLVTDLIFGVNREANGLIPAGNDTFGLVIMPYYNITDNLQAVVKYAYMDEGRNQRTQRFDVRQRVSDYHTFYAGLNYFICEHNLKLMAGYEYATGEEFGTGVDIDSSTWMVGIRTYF